MREVVSHFHSRNWRLRVPIEQGLLFFLIALLLPRIAESKWNLIANFNTPINCGFFFDENHGLIGSGIRLATFSPCAIYKTTDAGATWTPCAVPTTIDGAVTNIWFQDSLTGYASIFSQVDYYVYNTFGRTALWKTTDGGNTWFDPMHLDHVLTDVYVQHGLIVITDWDNSQGNPNGSGGSYSYDGGATWTQGFRRCNGIAFSDSLNGVVTEMNANPGGDNFWYTMDAGRTWLSSATSEYESWSVCALPSQRMYFCANESQPTIPLPYSNVNWSSDGGATWSVRTAFSQMFFTGTLAGAGQTLYFQTDTTIAGYVQGLYRSDNLGATWHAVGGPVNSRDTRFVVTGCMGQTVYAFDDVGGVYKTTDGGDGTLQANIAFPNDTIYWEPNVCGDSIPISIGAKYCIPITIDSVFIPPTSEFLSFANGTIFPKTLSNPDSTTIQLIYSPTKGGRVASAITVFGHAGNRSVTKVLTIITNNTLASGISLSKDSCSLRAGACATDLDSIVFASAACQRMVLDSVVLPSGEIVSVNSFPIALANEASYPVYFAFSPDSAGTHSIMAHLYAHAGRRPYDTTISISAESVQPPVHFVLDTTALTFATKFCNPLREPFLLSTNACDSLILDSISASEPFSLDSIPSSLFPSGTSSIGIIFQPDSAGLDSGIVHVYAHSRAGRCDTTVELYASNFALPQIETISDTAMTLATSGCQSLIDTFIVGNEGCDSLIIDSAILSDDSELFLRYDSARVPIAGGGTVPIQILYNPQNGTSKSCSIQLHAHAGTKIIDTTISLALSNAIPADPLRLSTDSLWLFTKYCQPVAVPLHLGNFGCQVALDSFWISGDMEQEFSFIAPSDSLRSGSWDSCSIKFVPNGPGNRSLQAHFEFLSNGKEIDTTLSVAAKNLTAPAPYIPPLPSLKPAAILAVPLMIEPTSDTFTIHSYSFHLSFNTNLLTPAGLDFSGTCDTRIDSSHWWPTTNGISGRVWIQGTISDTAHLDLPLVFVNASVALTLDTTTIVTLDTFVTDREPTLAPCSIPSQPFTLLEACGDPELLEAMRDEPISFSFISVSPNPAHNGNWDVAYQVNRTGTPMELNVYSADGNRVSQISSVPSSEGPHVLSVPIIPASGDYFLVLKNSSEAAARKTSVEH